MSEDASHRLADGGLNRAMTNATPRRTFVVPILGALIVLLVLVPAVVSLASGDGALCFADSACPLSAVNPCMRRPAFALVGRCAVGIK